MSLLKQNILCIVQNCINPLFEPIIIDNKIIKIFRELVDTLDVNQPIEKQFKKTKRLLKQIPNDDFSTHILKTNLIVFLDTIIQIQRTNDKQIKKLRSKLLYKNKLLIKTKSSQQSVVILDTSSSQQLRDATTFGFTVS